MLVISDLDQDLIDMLPCFYCMCLILFSFVIKIKFSVYFDLFISLLMTALYHLGLMALSTHLSMVGNLDSFWLKINLLYLMFLIKFLFALHLATINMSSHRALHTIYKFCQLTPSWFDCSAFRAYTVLPSTSLSCWSSNVKSKLTSCRSQFNLQAGDYLSAVTFMKKGKLGWKFLLI